MKIKILFVVLTFSLVFIFQNCSKVALEVNKDLKPFIASGNVDICLDGSLANYTLESHHVTNLNITVHKDSVLLDSDADGIADIIELENGSDAENRYSAGPVLDSICLAQKGITDCRNLSLNCDPAKLNSLGLNDCDLEISGLNSFSHPTIGLDSDRDGFLDNIEIIRGTMPNVNDGNNDPDKDLVLNSEELRSGTNPNYSDKSFNVDLKISSTASKNNSSACSGENWLLKFSNVHILEANKFTDSLDLKRVSTDLLFSREKDENIIFISLVLTPKLGYTGNSIIYTYSQKIHRDSTSGIDLSILFNKFVKNGEVKVTL